MPRTRSSASLSEVEDGDGTHLSFLGLNLFVKPVSFILEMCQHRLKTIRSVHQRRVNVRDQHTLSERQLMPLCLATFFMAIGSPPKNFISFSSQMTYPSSVPT